jgi:hypothetical protein
LTAGGAGAPNFTAYSGTASTWSVTSATRYATCPGNSASQGCVVGGLVSPTGLNSTLTVPLDAPGTLLTPRVSQLDLSFSKQFNAGAFKINPKVDIFNALNSDDYFAVRTVSYTPVASPSLATAFNGSGGTYLQPGSILQGRIFRIGAVVIW